MFNPATAFIDFCHRMGWAWDLKKATQSLVKAKMLAHGEQSVSPGGGQNSWKTWIRGLLACFAPWFALRWALAALM